MLLSPLGQPLQPLLFYADDARPTSMPMFVAVFRRVSGKLSCHRMPLDQDLTAFSVNFIIRLSDFFC